MLIKSLNPNLFWIQNPFDFFWTQIILDPIFCPDLFELKFFGPNTYLTLKWCSMWSTEKNHSHEDRVLHSMMSRPENWSNLYLSHKDHKKEMDTVRDETNLLGRDRDREIIPTKIQYETERKWILIFSTRRNQDKTV